MIDFVSVDAICDTPLATQTIPLAVFQKLQTDQEGAIALSLVLVILSICVLVALRDRITGTG